MGYFGRSTRSFTALFWPPGALRPHPRRHKLVSLPTRVQTDDTLAQCHSASIADIALSLSGFYTLCAQNSRPPDRFERPVTGCWALVTGCEGRRTASQDHGLPTVPKTIARQVGTHPTVKWLLGRGVGSADGSTYIISFPS